MHQNKNNIQMLLNKSQRKENREKSSDEVEVIYLEPHELNADPDNTFDSLPRIMKDALIASISEHGIIDPVIAYKSEEDGLYYISAGHNRIECAKEAKCEKIPVIVRERDYYKRISVMADTNLLRRTEPSLKEYVKTVNKLADAYKRKAGRKSIDNINEKTGERLDEIIAKKIGKTRSQVSQFLKMGELIPELLEKANDEKIKTIPAFTIAFLNKQHQTLINKLLDDGVELTIEKANELKQKSQEGSLNNQDIADILCRSKSKQFKGLQIKPKQFIEYLPDTAKKDLTEEKAKQIFGEAMELWRAHYNKQ